MLLSNFYTLKENLTLILRTVLNVLTQGVTTNNLWILPAQSFRIIAKTTDEQLTIR